MLLRSLLVVANSLTRMATPSAETNKQRDLVTRGSNEQSPFGKAVFVGLRMTDSLLQYGMLAHGIGSGLINAVGLRTLPQVHAKILMTCK